MKLLCGVLVFIAVFALNNAAGSMTLKRLATDQLLMQQLMQARANNPAYTEPCFNTYLPIFSAILEEFSASYQLCNTIASAEENELSAEALGNKTIISEAAQGVCNTMISCSALNDSLEFLDCYSQVGDSNIKTLYILTNNATDVAAEIREQIHLVENQLEKCHNASERNYVESTSETTEALGYCLKNGPPEVVTTTTEGSTTTEEETTTEDSTTTPAEEETTTPAEEETTTPADEETTTPVEEETTTPADEETTTPADEETTTPAEEETTTPADEETTTPAEEETTTNDAPTAAAFEEEDLSRSAPLAPKLLALDRFKRSNRQKN